MTGRKTTHDVKGARRDKGVVVEASSPVVCSALLQGWSGHRLLAVP